MGSSTASGSYSTSTGISTASGDFSTALSASTASGGWGFSAGSSIASGQTSTALGGSIAAGNFSTSIGYNTIAKGYSSTVIGIFNDSILATNEVSINPTTPLFIVGNGDLPSIRSNALTILKNGRTGISTTTPQATLDVKGNQRFGGLSSYTTFDSLTGRIEWRNSNLYVPVTQALMKHSAAADGLFYNNTAPVSGQLEYRNASGEPVFYTNFVNSSGYFKGNLGIESNITQQLIFFFTFHIYNYSISHLI